jgi:hypothetical protein
LHVFGNNSKTVNNIRSLAPFGQAVSEEKIFLTLANQKQELPLAAIFVELLPFFHQIFKILILFVFYFKNYKR